MRALIAMYAGIWGLKLGISSVIDGIYCSNYPDMILTVIMVVPDYYLDIYIIMSNGNSIHVNRYIIVNRQQSDRRLY